MGRNKGSQRTKGNVKPSSSERSAELLGNASTVGFIGFGSSCNTPVLPTSSGYDELDTALPGSVRMVMNRFGKKDPTTKMKALEDFIELCQSSEEDVLKGLLPYWPRFFLKLSQDSHHRVREMCHRAHYELVVRVKRELAPYLKSVMPQWLLSQNDVYAPAASAAEQSFQAAFQISKQKDAVLFCKHEIINVIKDNLLSLTPDSQSDQRDDVKEKMSRYERIVSSSLLGLKSLIQVTSETRQVDPAIIDAIEDIMNHPKFWLHFNSSVVQVTCSWLGLVSVLCQYTPKLIQKQAKKLVPALLNRLCEKDPILAVGIWECSLCVLLAVPLWSNYVHLDSVMYKLFAILKSGGQGNALRIYPNVAPFVAMIPNEALATKPAFFTELLNHFQQSLELPSVRNSPSEGKGVLKSYFQCLQFYLLKRYEFGNWVAVFNDNFLPLIKMSILEGIGTIPHKFIYNQLGGVLEKIVLITKDPSMDTDFQNHCCVILDLFWNYVFPIIKEVILSSDEHFRPIQRAADLLHCLKYPDPEAIFESKGKVRFQSVQSSPVKELSEKSISQTIPTDMIKELMLLSYTTAIENSSSLAIGLFARMISDNISLEMIRCLVGAATNSPCVHLIQNLVLPYMKIDRSLEDLISIITSIYPMIEMKNDILHEITKVQNAKILMGLVKHLSMKYSGDLDLQNWLGSNELGSILSHMISSSLITMEENDTILPLVELVFWVDSDLNPMIKYKYIGEIIDQLNEWLSCSCELSTWEESHASIIDKVASSLFIIRNWWSIPNSTNLLVNLCLLPWKCCIKCYEPGIKSLVVAEQWSTLWICCEKIGEKHLSGLNVVPDPTDAASRNVELLKIIASNGSRKDSLEPCLDKRLETALRFFLPHQMTLEQYFEDIDIIHKVNRSVFYNEGYGIEAQLNIGQVTSMTKTMLYIKGHLNEYVKLPVWASIFCVAVDLCIIWQLQLAKVSTFHENSPEEIKEGNVDYDDNLSGLYSTIESFLSKLEPGDMKSIKEDLVLRVMGSNTFWSSVLTVVCKVSHSNLVSLEFDFSKIATFLPLRLNVELMEADLVAEVFDNFFSEFSSGLSKEKVSYLKAFESLLKYPTIKEVIVCEKALCLLRIILGWRESVSELFMFDSSQDELKRSPEVIQLVKVVTVLLQTCHMDMLLEDWSNFHCCCYAWCQTINSWLNSTISMDAVTCTFMTSYYEMLSFVVSVMSRNQPKSDNSEKMKVREEWDEFFADEFFSVTVQQFLKLQVFQTLNPNVEKVLVSYLKAMRVFLQRDPSPFFPKLLAPEDSEYPLKMTCEHTSAFNQIFPFLLSSCSSVRWSAYLLTSCIMNYVGSSLEVPELLEDVLAPHPAILEALTTSESVVVACLADYPVGLFCQVSPKTDSYTYSCAYLLSWSLLLKWLSLLPDNVKFLVTEYLHEKGHSGALLDSLFKFISGSIPVIKTESPVKDGNKANRHQYLTTIPSPGLGTENSDDVVQLAWQTYFLCVTTLPAMVRSWWRSTDRRINQLVEQLTRDNVSDLVCQQEMEAVLKCEKVPNLLVKTRPSIREVIAVYDLQEAQMELVIQLPSNYPLGFVKVESGEKVCVGVSQWRTWLLQLSTFLSYQNGSVLSGILLWKKNVDKKFEGVEECYICFYVLHGSNYQLPRLSCSTCKKKFHSACLYKWFSTSHNTTCPLCRNPF